MSILVKIPGAVKKLTKNLPKKYHSRYFSDRHTVNKLLLALDLKIGDLFHGCDGYNHILKHKEVRWASFRDFTGSGPWCAGFIHNIDLVGEDGHSGDVLHCVTLPVPSAEQINQYHYGWVSTPKGREMHMQWWPDITEKLIHMRENNLPVCDERGIKLPWDEE